MCEGVDWDSEGVRLRKSKLIETYARSRSRGQSIPRCTSGTPGGGGAQGAVLRAGDARTRRAYVIASVAQTTRGRR